MRMTLAFVCLGAIIVSAGCSGSSTSPTTSTTSVTMSNDVLNGTVQPPVNGALQSAFNTFVVGQGGGSISVTLTSAIETLPGGVLLPTVTMGLGVGSVTNGTCSVLANSFTTAQAGSAPQLSGTLSANGTYCVQVSDVSTQIGPVAYTVLVSHP
jgi:hypothetical protein